jgi:hypothetical protein
MARVVRLVQAVCRNAPHNFTSGRIDSAARMPTDMYTWVADTWSWLRNNDVPNWLVVAFTIVLWPLALFLWQRRKVNGVPGLEVHFAPGNITIGGKPFSAVDMQVTNHTGSVVYINRVRIRDCTRAFPVPVEAARDIAENSYHLKFMNADRQFVQREVTLQTNASAKTCMPATDPLPKEFYTYSSS